MSNLQKYDRILAGLQAAKRDIRSNIQQLQAHIEYYSWQIDAMQTVGFLEDYAEKLKAYNGLQVRIDGLNEFLEQILRKIAEIENHIQELKADTNRTK